MSYCYYCYAIYWENRDLSTSVDSLRAKSNKTNWQPNKYYFLTNDWTVFDHVTPLANTWTSITTVLLVLLGQSPGSLVTSRPGGCWLQFWYAIIMVARQYGWERLCDSRWLRKMSNRQFEKVALLIKYYPVIGQEIRCILHASLQTVNTFKNLTDFAKQTCFQISDCFSVVCQKEHFLGSNVFKSFQWY